MYIYIYIITSFYYKKYKILETLAMSILSVCCLYYYIIAKISSIKVQRLKKCMFLI